MDCSKGADKAAKDPSEKKGYNEHPYSPPESGDELQPGQEGREPNQRIQLEKPSYRLTKP
jgi:hypothetical protein